MKSKISVTIHGWYGAGNLGDAAILEALLILLRTSFSPKVNILAYSNELGLPDVAVLDLTTAQPEQIHDVIASSDIFILGGGGLIKDFNEDNSVLRWTHFLGLAQRLGKLTVLWSIGADYITSKVARIDLLEVLNMSSLITVRDYASKEALLDLGINREVNIIGDSAVYLTRNLIRKRIPSQKLNIGINLCHWFRNGTFIENELVFDRFLNECVDVINLLINRYDCEIVLLPFNKLSVDYDLDIINYVYSKVSVENRDRIIICDRVPPVENMLKIINRLDVMIGMRLHSVILAYSMGIPVIGIEYMPKLRHYLKSVNLDRYCVLVSEFSTKLLISIFHNILVDYHLINDNAKIYSDQISNSQEQAIRSVRRLFFNT